MDRLTLFLSQFPVTASVFHAGTVAHAPLENASGLTAESQGTAGAGYLYVFKRGTFLVEFSGHPDVRIEEPSLLYCPKAISHNVEPLGTSDNMVLGATINLGSCNHSPLANSLPAVIVLALARATSLDQVLSLLCAEASSVRCGSYIAQNRLTEYFLVLLLRELLEQKIVDFGLLAGLADHRLARVVTGLQESPADRWTLEDMASVAGMSRARFAARFKAVVGITPHQFLTDWRIALTMDRLRAGQSLQTLADDVGYSQPAALTRAFHQRTGLSPRAWLKLQASVN